MHLPLSTTLTECHFHLGHTFGTTHHSLAAKGTDNTGFPSKVRATAYLVFSEHVNSFEYYNHHQPHFTGKKTKTKGSHLKFMWVSEPGVRTESRGRGCTAAMP